MSISLIYKSVRPTNTPMIEEVFFSKYRDYFQYAHDFMVAHPEVKVYGLLSELGETVELRSELEFPDQATLDQYLTDPRNVIAQVDNMLADPEMTSFRNTNNVTQTVTTVENSDKTGLVQGSVAGLAETLSNY